MEIKICVGTTCHLLGSSSLVEAINELPEEIKTQVTLKYSTCFDKCQQAMKPPVICLNNDYFDDMNPVKIKQLIMEKAGESE